MTSFVRCTNCILFFNAFFLIASNICFAETKFRSNLIYTNSYVGSSISDTVTHSPKRATILSAILPGAGQAYNKKYWKIPVIYGAGATGAYFIHTNLKQYKRFRQAYIYRNDGNPDTVDEFPQATSQQLQVYRDHYRRNTELAVILTTVFYLLQILDATVDAHLYDFDVSSDISLQYRLFNNTPLYNNTPANLNISPVGGLSVIFKFNKPRKTLTPRSMNPNLLFNVPKLF